MAEKTIGKLVIDIEARLGKLETQLKKAENESVKAEGKLNSAFAKIGSAIAAAFATEKIIQFGKEAVQLAAKVEGIETAFKKLNDPGLLGQLRAATKGTVSDWQLMQKAVQANNFKIPMDTLAAGLEFAHMRAIETGESIDYLVDSLVTGLGRKSAPILDNLGISMVELQEEIAKVGDFSTAAMNIMKRALENAGQQADTTTDKMARLNAEIENQKVKIGKGLTPVYHAFLGVVASAIETIRWQIDLSGMLTEQYEKLTEIHERYGKQLMNTYVKSTKNSKDEIETIGKLKQELENLTKAQEETDTKSKTFAENKKKILEIQSKINKLTEVEQNNTSKIDAIYKSFYESMKFHSKDYYDFRISQINREYEEFKKAGVSQVDLEKWKLQEIQRLKQAQFEFDTKDFKPRGPEAIPFTKNQGTPGFMRPRPELPQVDAQTEALQSAMEDVADDVQKYSSIAANAFTSFTDLLQIKSSQSASAVEKAFTSMVNSILQELMRLALSSIFVKLFGAIATGGASLAAPGVGLLGHYGGTFQGGRKVASFARGGEFTVPHGYPNDSYPIMVESYERVKVTPSQQVGQSEKLLSAIVGEVRALVNITASKETNVTVVNQGVDARTKVKKDGRTQATMVREGNKLSER